MMKKSLFLVASAALLALASCTDDNLGAEQQRAQANETPDNAVTFGTNISRSRFTRTGIGGETGGFDTDKLRQSAGFGVFAYSTGTQTYENWRTEHYPNFMYNQQVKYDADNTYTVADYVTHWYYSPMKYWPNEVQQGDVDDQNDDLSKDPAQGTGGIGGNLSFFAYAPYVDINTEASQTTLNGFHPVGDAGEDASEGIIGISGNKFVGDSDHDRSDPYVQYVIPSGGKIVDLLWGTTGMNQGTDVVGNPNLGVSATVYGGPRDFNVNADLTKQTTKGMVVLLFKHALAKVGGSYTGTGNGSDQDASTPTNGLMVILDIDDQKGGETGGFLEDYLAKEDLEAGSVDDDNLYNTKVTIEKVELESTQELTDDGANAIKAGDFDVTISSNFQNLRNKGDLNLANGNWCHQEAVGDHKQEQTIEQSEATEENPTADDDKQAILNHNIMEPKATPARTKAGFESLPIGVTTVAKNVYENEAYPFVFIPGTRPVIKIAVTYIVRTYDPKLADKYSEVRQRITKNLYITDPVELNKQYNILMHIGLTSVKFTATVDDWQVDMDSHKTIDAETGDEVIVYEEEIEHVYLPINVGDATEGVTFTPEYTSNAYFYNSTDELFGSQKINKGITLQNPTLNGKTVNLSHVLLTSDADWVSFTQDYTSDKIEDYKQYVHLAVNNTLQERTATIYATYDNKKVPVVTIKQRASTIKGGTLRIGNTNEPTVVAGAKTYNTNLRVTEYNIVNAKGELGSTTGTLASPVTLTEGYTLKQETADTWVSLSVTQVSLDKYNSLTGTRTSNEIKAIYTDPTSGKNSESSVQLKITQDVVAYGYVHFLVSKTSDIDNKGESDISFTVTGDRVDGDNTIVQAGVAIVNAEPTTTADWLHFMHGSGNQKMTVDENRGPARSAELVVIYNGIESNKVTVSQNAATLNINFTSATAAGVSATANSEGKVSSVMLNGHESLNMDDVKLQISCDDNGNWATIAADGTITVQANGSGVARTATITASYNGVSAKRTITQKGA